MISATVDKMRIGLDARELARQYTGIGNYVLNLIHGLIHIREEADYFLFIESGTNTLVNLALPANFHLVRVSLVGKFQDQLGLLWAARRVRLDLLHVTHHDVTPLLSPIPLVVTVHDIAPMDFCNPSWMHKNYYHIMSWLALQRAQWIVCDSESTGRRIERHFPFVAGKWSTIHLGCDDYFRVVDDAPCFQAMARALGIRFPFILYVGSFARRKNPERLLISFQRVIAARPDVQLVMVGGPSGRDNHVFENLPPQVIFTGQVDKRQLRALYNNASLLLFPSWYEGFGLPVLEAMACGCPVVTSNTYSLPELAGDAALLVDPGDPEDISTAVLQVLSDKEFRLHLQREGLRRVRAFSWKQTAYRTYRVYHTIAERKKRSKRGIPLL